MMFSIEESRTVLQNIFNELCIDIGKIPIGKISQFPYGWRKAEKGRTVWRIVEEIISQNLEYNKVKYNIEILRPACSEVGVYDFQCKLFNYETTFYINIKAAVINARPNRDDISKAEKLLDFVKKMQKSELFVATFIIVFNDDATIHLEKCIVMPIHWVPDIYVNPSNNGNLQSARCKDTDLWDRRSKEDFIDLLQKEILFAQQKKTKSF